MQSIEESKHAQSVGESKQAGSQSRLAMALAAVAVVLAAVSVLDATSWAQHRRALLAVVEQAGLEQAPLVRRIEREGTSHHADVLTARSIVYHVLASQEPEARERVARQLPEARRLAGDALRAQPNSWQATMLLGMATYLERSLGRDPRLYTEAELWEQPLAKAVRDASGHPEPRRLLATAYLETWHALSPGKRGRARELLRQVFNDDIRAFEALSPAWFGLGLSLDESLEIVPEDPQAWATLEGSFAQRSHWRGFIVAHQRRLDALEKVLRRERVEAETRLRLGDYYDSRSMLLRVLQRAPPSLRFMPLVSEALELYPPGLHGFRAIDSLHAWVDWMLELARLDIRTLSPEAVGRLLDALGELEPETAARLALLADDPYQAERFEKLSQPLTLVSWAPYLIDKAKRQASRGNGLGARESLAQVSPAAREHLSYLMANRQAAAAVGDLPVEAEARARLEEQRRRAWRAMDWRWRGGRPTLDLLPRGQGEVLELEIAEAPRDGAVVDVRWDGGSVALRAVRSGDRLRLEVAVDSRPHVLEVRSLAGGRVAPGAVTLR